MHLPTATFRDEVFYLRKEAEDFAKRVGNQQGLYAVVRSKRIREDRATNPR